ncbi:MAG: MgtC/SapB family protein [Ignavibacteriales bacterium]
MNPVHLVRLFLAAIVGAAVGFERERINRAAGLRTHILVCTGSALVMLVSTNMVEVFGYGDPGRIAAQVVTGVGFLGAGTILREGPTVRGLTTAAGLWVVSGLGLAIGLGMYVPALFTSAVVLGALFLLPPLERRLAKREGVITVVMDDKPGQLGLVATILGRHGIDIRHVEFETMERGMVGIAFRARFQPDTNLAACASDLAEVKGISSVDLPRA